jgi:DNA ligase 1
VKFSPLCSVYEQLSNVKNEPERMETLAQLFSNLDRKTLGPAVHLTVGEIVEPELSDQLGIGPGAIRRALSELTGMSLDQIDDEVRETGDMSAVAARLSGGKDSIEVHSLWQRVHTTVTEGTDRVALLKFVYGRTNALGAKYFTRILLNQMRIGVGYGTVIKALAKAFEVRASLVERLYALTNDIGYVAEQAKRGEKAVAASGVTLFRPYQFMNAQKVDDPNEIFRRLHGKEIIFETKYDGARLQIHFKSGRKPEVKLYSRRLNDDTEAMPDVVASLIEAWKGRDAIIEGEAVAFDPTLRRKLPFQSVLMRLGRVHDIEEKAKEIPLVLHLFDILFDDGEDLMNVPLVERRSRLKSYVRPTERVKLADEHATDRPAAMEKYFKRAIKAGHEGLMAKDPDGSYVPGRRTDKWMKIKPAFETLDVVVVGGIWGSGRRKGTLSSLVVAIRNTKNELKTVGKVGTGFSEQALAELTQKLVPAIITSKGRNVEIEPSMVIEVDFQDIQKTSAYSSGYALRIPRFKRERVDKSVREADTIDRLKQLYEATH